MGLQDLYWEETVTIMREIGPQDRRCDIPVTIEVRWDFKTFIVAARSCRT